MKASKKEIVDFLSKLQEANKSSYEANMICKKKYIKHLKILVKAIKGKIEVNSNHIDLINQANKKLEYDKIGIYIGLLKTQFN